MPPRGCAHGGPSFCLVAHGLIKACVGTAEGSWLLESVRGWPWAGVAGLVSNISRLIIPVNKYAYKNFDTIRLRISWRPAMGFVGLLVDWGGGHRNLWHSRIRLSGCEAFMARIRCLCAAWLPPHRVALRTTLTKTQIRYWSIDRRGSGSFFWMSGEWVLLVGTA